MVIQMKKLSTLLYFPLLLLIINGTVTQSKKDPPICSSSCGDSLHITYPFRLKHDPVACGDRDYQLYCQNNKTIMNFHGGLYYVNTISYDDHTIHLADVNLSNGSCSLPYRSLTMGEIQNDARFSGSFNYSYSYALNYVRCRDNITSDFVDNNTRVPCLSRNSTHVYVNISKFSLNSYDVPETCKVIARAPAFWEGQLPEKPSYETALKMQELGFLMRWSVECRDCRAKGRGCVYKADMIIFQCQKEYDYYSELRLIYTIIVSWFLSAFIGFVRFILLPLVIWAFILHKYLSTRNKTDYRHTRQFNR